MIRCMVLVMAAVAMVAGGEVGAEETWYPYPVEIWDPPFDMASPRTPAEYVPLEKASRNHKTWKHVSVHP